MDSSAYKNLTTSRGFIYHYFFSPSVDPKPTILFISGFPSTSYEWRHQVTFFQKEHYGLIVPDLLGYGGTDKPNDMDSYKPVGVTADIIDILKAERVNKVIAIGHDWGCLFVSRLALYYPDYFLAFGFLCVPYMPPSLAPLKTLEQAIDYGTLGYWPFLSEDGADKIIESHFDSLFSILYPYDPGIWRTDMAPKGKLKAWVLSDKTGPLPPYITEADKQKMKEELLSGGFVGPLMSYRLAVSGISFKDEKNLPEEKYIVNHPVFFGAAAQDYICLSKPAMETIGDFCKNVTVKEFNTGHWVQLAAPDELNKELLAWIDDLKL